MPDSEYLVELLNFIQEIEIESEMIEVGYSEDAVHKMGVEELFGFDIRKEIGQDISEERNILICELGYVDIYDGFQDQLAFFLIGKFPLELASTTDNTLDGPHPEVIMLLATDLFTGQFQTLLNL